jgi:hypothetical protein
LYFYLFIYFCFAAVSPPPGLDLGTC